MQNRLYVPVLKVFEVSIVFTFCPISESIIAAQTEPEKCMAPIFFYFEQGFDLDLEFECDFNFMIMTQN